MAEVLKLQNKWYGGMVRDDKSQTIGACFNIEEVDIFGNADFVQGEQVFSAEANVPTGTELFAKAAGDDDVVYGYGKETAGGKVRIVSVASGGTDNPGDFTTLFTSFDTTNLAYIVSDLKFFRTSEGRFLYFVTNTAGNAVKLCRLNLDTLAEFEVVGTLTGLKGSYDHPTEKVIFGELFTCNGQYMAKVDKDGLFTEKAYTLPRELESVDIVPVSDISIILCRNKNRLMNASKGIWWDLTSTATFNDSFNIPMGGPCWIFNHNETIKILTCINGEGQFWQLASANPGAVLLKLPGLKLTGLASENPSQPISSPKMVDTKGGVLYFGLWKSAKAGLYALGQMESDKPNALLLSKRFATTNYAQHRPTSLLIQGPNFYADFIDNGQNSSVRCESNNNPNRSTSWVIEGLWVDANVPFQTKDLTRAYLSSYPLPTSTSLDLYVAPDYDTNYTQIKRANDTIFNSANGVFGLFRPAAFKDKYVYRYKVIGVSNGANSPKLTGVGLRLVIKDIQ